MIARRLFQELGIDPRTGDVADQFRRLGYEDLGEGNDWADGSDHWPRIRQAREVYSTPAGYHLYADPALKLIYHTHSGD